MPHAQVAVFIRMIGKKIAKAARTSRQYINVGKRLVGFQRKRDTVPQVLVTGFGPYVELKLSPATNVKGITIESGPTVKQLARGQARMPLQLAPNFLKIAYGTSARVPIQLGRNLRDGRVLPDRWAYSLSQRRARAPGDRPRCQALYNAIALSAVK